MTRLVPVALALALAGCTPPASIAGPRATDPGRPDPAPDAGAPPDAIPDAMVIDPGVIRAEVAPPPILGGTMAVSADGETIVASDPDVDTISIVRLATGTVRTIALARGDEPFRVAIDGSGRAHVVLRRAGTIADVDLATATVLGRRSVCASPRGIAWRASDDSLHVACLEGLLVSLPASGGAITRSIAVADDLRDVLVRGDDLYVTRFRVASLLRLAPDGAIADARVPAEAVIPFAGMRATVDGPFQPAIAWRAVATATGVAVLHQRAFSGEFFASSGYGSLGCGQAVVHDAVTHFGDDGALTMGSVLDDVVLGVDLAISPDGSRVAIAAPASAYRRDAGDIIFERDVSDVRVFSAVGLAADDPGRCSPPDPAPSLSPSGGAVVAVAFLPDGRLVAQTRAPAFVLVEGSSPTAFGPAIPLHDTNAFDTGHAIFHARTSGGLACASCHPEGGDDGRTWRFADFGARRTQTMRGHLQDTAPFHWSGDMPTFTELMFDVFGSRMGGSLASEAEAVAVGDWMGTMPAPARPVPTDPDAVARGDALFHDPTVGCASCHVGPALTSSATVDVGTGGAFQVPTLVGIAFRAPYMHDGCAPTLHDRFGPCGGGDLHGHTGALEPAQIDDLVAYLRTL